MKSLLRCLVASSIAVLPAARALDVSFLAWDEQVATRQIAVGESEIAVKELHPLKRTEAVTASLLPSGELALRALDRKDSSDKPLTFTVKLGTGMTKPLVLLLPDTKAASGLRGFAIEDDTSSFPWGTFRVLNSTGKPLNLALGSIRKQLPVGWQPVDLQPEGEKALPIAISTTEAPQEPLYTGIWKAEREVRRLVFIVPGTEPRLGPLAIKVIPEDRRILAATAEP
ncbi:hypothetical protein [Haloferula sp. BvORR071]|uniref:hypothetical protein n=1 Tax=Haloferula sp. BvORR071 TaxID=1396141 RepID=UPI00054CEBFD|nr:hypothetical protein [Haloferula sp. BvORR071]